MCFGPRMLYLQINANSPRINRIYCLLSLEGIIVRRCMARINTFALSRKRERCDFIKVARTSVRIQIACSLLLRRLFTIFQVTFARGNYLRETGTFRKPSTLAKRSYFMCTTTTVRLIETSYLQMINSQVIMIIAVGTSDRSINKQFANKFKAA